MYYTLLIIIRLIFEMLMQYSYTISVLCRNTVGALKRRPFASLTLSDKRSVVLLGPHKPVVTIDYTTKGGKPASSTHNPTVNPMGIYLLNNQFVLIF